GDYDLTRLDEEQRTRYRNLVVGYLWQQSGHNLLSDLSVAANVNLPQMLNGVSSARSAKRTHELLAMVGLADMAEKLPSQLSGGEQQRVAIAVALANQPVLLLADEPTGEVDSVTAQEIMAVLRQVNRELGQTIILVTHDTAVAACVDRTLAIRDGRTSTETIRRSPVQPLESQAVQPMMPASARSTFASAVPVVPAALDQLKLALAQAGLEDRLELHVVGDHLELWPTGTRFAGLQAGQSGGASSVIGLSLDSHRELVLVDRTGRLQLPKDALDLIPVNGRAEVQVAGDRVILWPFVAGEERAQDAPAPVQGNLLRMDGVQ
ncbi:MAG TPA: ATP-binding cassette domain-containing protein, partial [Ktedonobacteraceae bacterium]|nr:ATP-binding cassette domain-containing protein [Ktedonobacteraceae bacterium]